MKKIRFKINDKVKIITGKHRNNVDIISKIDKKKNVIHLKSLSIIRKLKIRKNNNRNKNNNKSEKKVFIPIHYSNISLVVEKKEEE